MKKIFSKDSFFMKLSIFKKVLCVVGIVFLVTGIIFVILSFSHEVLDDKYIIKTVTEYVTGDSNKLTKGELDVVKSTEYTENGIYKVTYVNYAKKNGDKVLLENNSYFYITDMLGNGYELISDKVKINDKEYNLSDNTISSEKGINISYDNNVINIEIPNTLLFDRNTIEVYIKLVARDVNVKYLTSQEAYFSFVPSIDNDFYSKKTAQSYVIDGYGYIELDDK